MAERREALATTASALLQLIDALRSTQDKPSPVDKSKYLCGKCPDPECKASLYFPSYERSIPCSKCYQRHDKSSLLDVKEMKDLEQGERQRLLSTMISSQSASEVSKRPEMKKIQGISHYECKLLSHLLTTHGMNKVGEPKLLRQLGGSETFDCSKLSKYAFEIDEVHLDQVGYGVDVGSRAYLADTLCLINSVNEGTTLEPLHADGDGHCLVHAVSRCLIGRELFWHSLRSHLQRHLRESLDQYKAHLKDFIEEKEWEEIIDEAGPDYTPPDDRGLGLRNIHIFGLANVLHRPIILLDSLEGMRSAADFSGVFLPAFVPPAECMYQESGQSHYNQPIVIGWSSPGHNHFVPLVQVKGAKSQAQLPRALCTKVWGVDASLLKSYTEEKEGFISVASGKAMHADYLKRLLKSMEKVFHRDYKVRPSLVAEMENDVYRRAGYVSMKPMDIAMITKQALQQDCLRRCLFCRAVITIYLEWYEKGGLLYNIAAEEFTLSQGREYYFPTYSIRARYDADADKLVPVSCPVCSASNGVRRMNVDGNMVYENGDRTDTASHQSQCGCGFKHYWDGREYDNLPRKLRLPLQWNSRTVETYVYWFEDESDPSLNSNVYVLARSVVEEHFPGEFGSERLVQSVVDVILNGTAKTATSDVVEGLHPNQVYSNDEPASPESKAGLQKWIAIGPKAKTLHKEELGMNQVELNIKQRVQENAESSSRLTKPTGSRIAEALRKQNSSKQPPKPSEVPRKAECASQSSSFQKRIRIATSEGDSATVTLSAEATFADFQILIAEKFDIACDDQILRTGRPPRMLQSPSNPSDPVDLSNGDKVTVERVPKPAASTSSFYDSLGNTGNTDNTDTDTELQDAQHPGVTSTAQQQLQDFLSKVDLWPVAVLRPNEFTKDGVYYSEVERQFQHKMEDGIHFMISGFPKKKFVYNQVKESIELCLGIHHIPIRHLTPEEELAAALVSSSEESGHNSDQRGSGASGIEHHMLSKAFSGKGHSLLPSSNQKDIKED